MLIAQKRGRVRVANGTTLDPTLFIDIADIVNHSGDRGLLDIAVHPDFENYPFVYLLFTYEGIEPEDNDSTEGLGIPNGGGNRAARLIRVTADENNGYRTAVEGSEVVLLGKNSTREYFNAEVDSTIDFDEPPGGINQTTGENVQDFVATDCASHSIGSLVFSPIDNALFVSTGDATSYNRADPRTGGRVQDIDNLSGKILRIHPLSGEGLPDNPFYDDDPNANRAKVFHLGLRNPFRISVDKVTGQLFVGDVGWRRWEEINSVPVGTSGANFGWPYYEGGNGISLVQENGYAETPGGEAFFSQDPPVNVTAPLYALSHSADGINAIVCGHVVVLCCYCSPLSLTLTCW